MFDTEKILAMLTKMQSDNNFSRVDGLNFVNWRAHD